MTARTLGLALAVFVAPLTGCASTQRPDEGPPAGLPAQVLSSQSDEPSLFLNSSAGSPVFGFLGSDALLDVLSPNEAGRVLVRVRGPMQVRAYVPAELLSLRVQRHGRVRGTPVYLGPDDRVVVTGPADEPSRLKVRATPQVGTLSLPSFEGTYPAVGLSPRRAPRDAATPPPGQPYTLPAGTPLSLREQPDGPVLAEVPAHSAPLDVRVLNVLGEWYAVRLGEGPYLVGYVRAPLTRGEAQAPTVEDGEVAQVSGPVPRRLRDGTGELKRVARGAKVSFDGRVIARLDQNGFARVLATYPSGEADALVAVDDSVTVRGLVQAKDLSAPANTTP